MTATLAFDSLLGNCLGDRELAVELLGIYRREAPLQLHAVETALAAGDPAELFQKLHRLKGMLSSICASEASRACAELEKQAALGSRTLSLVELRAAISRLDLEVAPLLAS